MFLQPDEVAREVELGTELAPQGQSRMLRFRACFPYNFGFPVVQHCVHIYTYVTIRKLF